LLRKGDSARYLDEIDWASDVDRRPEGYFFAVARDTAERVLSWRKTTCEQALYYCDHQAEIPRRYAGEYILLQENEVKWHDKSSYLRVSRRKLAGDRPDQAMWLKYVDPDETEGEHYEVYEKTLADLAMGMHIDTWTNPHSLDKKQEFLYNNYG
jgi:hypothetical protein